MNEAERAAKSDENWKRLKNLLNKRLESERQLTAILEKIKTGKADFSDTSRYSEIVSRHISEVLQDNLSELTSAGKKLACENLLSDHYDRINDVLGEVQVSIDEKSNIHIKPQKADFPVERVGKVASSLADPTVPQETIVRRAGSAVQNVAMSMHDDYIKKNAEFRLKAGLTAYIVRTDHGGCCDWCAKLAGRYRYPDEVPKDVYRRHDNCTCTVTYECKKQRQNVWSKRIWEADVDELEQRKDLSDNSKPTVLTKEQAKAKEKEALGRLTGGGESDIIKEKEYSEATKVIQNICEVNRVEYNKINKLPLPLSSDEIIQRLAGGDMTKGSCSSLAFAYIGNINGLDVLDFRGGNSLDVFSQQNTIEKMLDLPNIKGSITKVKKEAKGTFELLKGLELDKEYYLAAGEHVAIVRNTKSGLEYLELQSGLENGNGWTSFNKYGSTIKTLQKRFGCRKTVDKRFGKVWEKPVVLMDVDSFKDNAEFEHILGYINTSVDKQHKGVNGHVK